MNPGSALSEERNVGGVGFWETLFQDLRTRSFLKLTYKILFRPEGLATFLFRCSAAFYTKGKIGWPLAMVLWRLNIIINGCDIVPETKIGPGLRLVHPIGLVLTGNIGQNVSIYQNVTIGQNPNLNYKRPTIGDNVVIYAGAVIVGEINIGAGAVIGANTVITRSIPANAVARAPAPQVNVPEAHNVV